MSPSVPESSGAPAAPWGKVWVLALVLMAGPLVAMEVTLRRWGHTPLVVDDVDLWCEQREEASRGGPDTIALLGTSRMQLGFVPEILRDEFPGRTVVQLAVLGQHPVATLNDLADDPDFSGLVLCDIEPNAFLPEFLDDQAEHVRYYHTAWNSRRRIERAIRTRIQESLVFLSPHVSLRPLVAAIRRRVRLEPPVIYTWRDRSQDMDFARPGMSKPELSRAISEDAILHRGRDVMRDIPRDEWPGYLAGVERAIERIEGRGGKVVLIRFPASGRFQELDRQHYPRSVYWDELARRTRAATIHYEDIPGMARVPCIDGLHLDPRHASAFTRAVAAELRRRGIVQSSEEVPGAVGTPARR